MLSNALAQQIANDITDVIGHNVLITDGAGSFSAAVINNALVSSTKRQSK